ncbi:hypothetical protein ACFYVR_23340 [Rhodococcus sp. NPDC003318]|uniref:hypothetical protein n=1 Tax=Rhodococcus sp. NPDC003318 TaxID=3364503 RepID=UPI0036AF93DB
MASSGPNPVLAPIRRWVLFSRTHLAISVAGVAAVLFAGGAVFGENPAPRAATHEIAAAAAEPAAGAESISYELDEVSESLVVTKTAAWAASSAPATAMAYAHAFVDTTATDSTWANALGRHTADRPGDTVIAARPRTPVVITGPTVSTVAEGSDGATVRVSVPTQAGDLKVSVTVADAASGKRWVVDTPLPTLDLTPVDTLSLPASTAVPRTSTPMTTSEAPELSTAPHTSSPSTSTPVGPTLDLDKPSSAPTRDRGSDPVPVPGPIPIPDLDTPIPGGR